MSEETTEKEGKWTQWHENGKVSIESNWKDGKKDGKWTEWHENGKLESEYTMKEDEISGLSKEWHENGQLEHERKYKYGEEIIRQFAPVFLHPVQVAREYKTHGIYAGLFLKGNEIKSNGIHASLLSGSNDIKVNGIYVTLIKLERDGISFINNC